MFGIIACAEISSHLFQACDKQQFEFLSSKDNAAVSINFCKLFVVRSIKATL